MWNGLPTGSVTRERINSECGQKLFEKRPGIGVGSRAGWTGLLV